MFPPVWVYHHYILSIPHVSEQIMSIEADWNYFEFSKAPNPWEHTCSCKPQMYRCLISKDYSPPLFFSLSPFPLSFSPSTLTAATLPLHWTSGLLKYLLWSSLHFKVDFHPAAKSKEAARSGMSPSLWIIRTSKSVIFSYDLFENWRTPLKNMWLMLSFVHKLTVTVWPKLLTTLVRLSYPLNCKHLTSLSTHVVQ